MVNLDAVASGVWRNINDDATTRAALVLGGVGATLGAPVQAWRAYHEGGWGTSNAQRREDAVEGAIHGALVGNILGVASRFPITVGRTLLGGKVAETPGSLYELEARFDDMPDVACGASARQIGLLPRTAQAKRAQARYDAASATAKLAGAWDDISAVTNHFMSSPAKGSLLMRGAPLAGVGAGVGAGAALLTNAAEDRYDPWWKPDQPRAWRIPAAALGGAAVGAGLGVARGVAQARRAFTHGTARLSELGAQAVEDVRNAAAHIPDTLDWSGPAATTAGWLRTPLRQNAAAHGEGKLVEQVEHNVREQARALRAAVDRNRPYTPNPLEGVRFDTATRLQDDMASGGAVVGQAAMGYARRSMNLPEFGVERYLRDIPGQNPDEFSQRFVDAMRERGFGSSGPVRSILDDASFLDTTAHTDAVTPFRTVAHFARPEDVPLLRHLHNLQMAESEGMLAHSAGRHAQRLHQDASLAQAQGQLAGIDAHIDERVQHAATLLGQDILNHEAQIRPDISPDRVRRVGALSGQQAVEALGDYGWEPLSGTWFRPQRPKTAGVLDTLRAFYHDRPRAMSPMTRNVAWGAGGTALAAGAAAVPDPSILDPSRGEAALDAAPWGLGAGLVVGLNHNMALQSAVKLKRVEEMVARAGRAASGVEPALKAAGAYKVALPTQAYTVGADVVDVGLEMLQKGVFQRVSALGGTRNDQLTDDPTYPPKGPPYPVAPPYPPHPMTRRPR